MATRIIPIHELATDPESYLRKCSDSGEPFVVELTDHRYVAVAPIEDDDDLINDLIENNQEFRELVARSTQSPRKPFVPKAS